MNQLRVNKNWWVLLLFLGICYSVAAFGAQFTPGAWYEQLNRAPWNPPNAAFPIAWTILYAFIAIAGWLIFASGAVAAKILWVVQLTCNAAWSWLFFGQQWVGIALVDIALMAIFIAMLIKVCWSAGLRVAGWLLLPYLLWVLLATSLNGYIHIYN
jgi:tryptophan-rich sensory protein